MSTVSKSDLPAVHATWTRVCGFAVNDNAESRISARPRLNPQTALDLTLAPGFVTTIFSRFRDDLPDDVTAAVPHLGRGKFRHFEPQSAEEEGERGPQR